MVIAVLADIHANLQALDAVIADARAQGAQQFIVAGDLAIDGPHPTQSVDRVAELTPYVIRGNREEYLLAHRAGNGPNWAHHHQTATMQWSFERMGRRHWSYLEALPSQLSVRFGDVSIRVVHGSPWHSRGRLVPGENDDDIDRAARETTEDTLICAHTHLPWAGNVRDKLIVNPGSVGVHLDRPDNRAKYALLHITDGRAQAELRAVAYDVEALWRDIRESGLLERSPYWTMLCFIANRDGTDYCSPFLAEAFQERRRRGLPEEGFLPNDVWEDVWARWVQRLPQLSF